MKTNHTRAKLKRGESAVGTWLTLPDPVSARLMARVGFDWLTVELEHTPVNFETAAQSFAVIAGSGCVPLARVPWNTGENIKRVLDTGAYGIVVPMVNSRAEAEAAGRAATSGRGFSIYRHHERGRYDVGQGGRDRKNAWLGRKRCRGEILNGCQPRQGRHLCRIEADRDSKAPSGAISCSTHNIGPER